ncbi:MAG: pyridoxamine 5'-phosphate oxidase family protein [Bacteroidota bacterium]
MNPKTKVKRVPKRGHYDKETIYRILDQEFFCQVGFVHEGYPVVIPTGFGRHEDWLYVHGSTASRMIKDMSQGIDVCITVTKVTGIVLAKSAFHHSMNYESAVVFGKGELITDEVEKDFALKVISDHIIKGRWEEAREPNAKELKGTAVIKVPISEASAKIRTGGPVDDKADEPLPIWAGVVQIDQVYSIPDEYLSQKEELPASVKPFMT